MKFTAPLILAAAVSAAPQIVKRQEVSSAASSVVSSAASEGASSAASSIAASVSSALGTGTVSASAAAPTSSAPADFATGLIAALNNRQATVLATLVEPLAPQLGPVLQSGEWTLLAPGNEYLEAAVAAGFDTSNTTALVELLSYHLVPGSYSAASLAAVGANTVAATYLQDSMLGPNYTNQAVAFSVNEFGTTELIGQNISVLANATYENILIMLIDGVLTIPGDVTATLGSDVGANATTLLSVVADNFPDLATALQTTQGITVFAPSNEALAPLAETILALAGSDPTTVSNIISGHVLPQVVYSPNITDGLTATSLAGSDLVLTVTDGNVFVAGGGSQPVQVIRTDYIAANGVVHVIDGILADLSGLSAGGAASSGASSAAAPSASASASASA